jgi:hypothetical protein
MRGFSMKKRGVLFQPSHIALLFFLALWFGLACLSGALFSGFQIADDHEIISIHNDFKSHTPFITVLKREIKNDFSIRFRPLFYLDRILTIKIFGDIFPLWSVYRILLAVLTSFLLFLFARNSGFGFRESLLFPVLALLGTQTSIWLLRGPAEAPATLLFAFSLYCVSAREPRPRLLGSFAFAVSCVAMSLTKENYLLTLPALCILALYIDKSRNGISWAASFKMRWPAYAFLFCFVAADLFVIACLVGTNQTGYAGIQISARKFAVVFLEFLFYNGQGLVCAACMLLFAVFYKSDKEKPLVLGAILLTLTLLQTFVYAKSGLLGSQGRYVLPSSIGFGFVICLLLTLFRNRPVELSGKSNLMVKGLLFSGACMVLALAIIILLPNTFSDSILSVIAGLKGHGPADHWTGMLHLYAVRLAIVACIACLCCIASWKAKRIGSLAMAFACIMLCYCFLSAIGTGREISRDAKALRQCMEEIHRSIPDSSMIVIVADPGFHVEGIFSITRYLTIKKGMKNIRYWFFDSRMCERTFLKQWEDTTMHYFGTRKIRALPDLDSAQCLLFLKDMEKPFAATDVTGIQKDFTRKKWGDLVCFFHK